MSRMVFDIGGEDEEEKEEVILDKVEFGRDLVENVRGFGSEVEVLRWLLEEKPGELRLGREHYLEEREVKEFMKGLCLKLEVNGWEDRGKRLKYLNQVLEDKFVNKENVYKIVVQFLMLMATRPTAVVSLPLGMEEYSREPDEEEISQDEDSDKQKALLKEILGEEDVEETTYSSGDSLSDWSNTGEEDEEEISTKSGNSLPPGARPVRTSSSFGEFSAILFEKPDPEKLRREAEEYWREEQKNAQKFLHSTVRRFRTFPLRGQPVISSLLVLHQRFGEFWEWKQRKDPSTLQVAFSEDIVREVLWQLVISKPECSPVFNPDWTVKKHLMVASLSKVALDIFLGKVGSSLKKLEILRKFERDVMRDCHHHGGNNPSKIYRCYAQALQELEVYILEVVGGIERELKRLPRSEEEPDQAPATACTTFVQLERQTKDIFEIIELVFTVHSKSVNPPDVEGEKMEEPWLAGVKLISTIEAYLELETRPGLHGVLLYFYSRCLKALLDDILSAMRSLQWEEKYSLFIRDKTVQLNDPNFWSDCVRIRDEFLEEECLSIRSLGRLSSVRELLPKVLNILKTCEVFNQLEEDFTQILGDAGGISVDKIVEEFLEESLFGIGTPPKMEDAQEEDFFKHFDALGLGNSLAANCFRFLEDTRQGRRKEVFSFSNFFKMEGIPVKGHDLTLSAVLSKWFDPFCLSATQRIENIFKEFQVLERITVFQEIILAVREDFARGIILIAQPPSNNNSSKVASKDYKFEDTLARNWKFQRLLNDCYPPEVRGDVFSIDLKLDPASDMNCVLEVTPKFPLNLIVTPMSVAGYLFIGRQLHRIRKSLWAVSSLSIKECCGGGCSKINASSGGGVDRNRLLIFRFCLINFCSSLRSFFQLKVFSRGFAEYAGEGVGGGGDGGDGGFENDLDYMRRVHENYLDLIQTKMLRHPLIQNVLIKQMTTMSQTLTKFWTEGIPPGVMLQLEDNLKKCWQVVNEFDSQKYSPDFNELSYHFGPPPSYLTN